MFSVPLLSIIKACLHQAVGFNNIEIVSDTIHEGPTWVSLNYRFEWTTSMLPHIFLIVLFNYS